MKCAKKKTKRGRATKEWEEREGEEGEERSAGWEERARVRKEKRERGWEEREGEEGARGRRSVRV